MWKSRWNFKEAIALNLGFIIIGILLQLFIGKCKIDLISHPIDFYVVLSFILLLSIIYYFFNKTYIIKWLVSLQVSVTIICSLLLLVIIMGLVRQNDENFIKNNYILSRIGFSIMLKSWAFVFEYIFLLIALEFIILKNIFNFRFNRIPFLLNHLGIFIVLLFGFLSTNNLQRYKMVVTTEYPEWRATDDNNKMFELPVAIQLNKFDIEEYLPKIMLINSKSGNVLMKNKKPFSTEINKNNVTKLFEWEVNILDFLENSAPVYNHDTLNYVEYLSQGATVAAMVIIKNTLTNQTQIGWLSCGSFIFPYKPIELNDTVSLVMARREPKRYTSDVNIYTKDGKALKATIEVNKPFKVNNWQIYQVNYDQNKGKWSDISVLELVNDAWIKVVYIGLIMMILGAVSLFIFAKNNN